MCPYFALYGWQTGTVSAPIIDLSGRPVESFPPLCPKPT